MQTHQREWGTSSVSRFPSPGSETQALPNPKGRTRREPLSSGYDPGLVGDFFVEWQQAADLAQAGQSS